MVYKKFSPIKRTRASWLAIDKENMSLDHLIVPKSKKVVRRQEDEGMSMEHRRSSQWSKLEILNNKMNSVKQTHVSPY
jgi:hypothetical protein